MAVAANRFQLARTLDEDRAQLRAPLQSDVIQKQQHVVYADGLRTAGPGQTLRFNLPTDPGKFLDTIGSYFSCDLTITTAASAATALNDGTPTDNLIPLNGIASMISMVRLVSRGQIIEEISEYGLIHQIVHEVTIPRDELASTGWISGEAPRGTNTTTAKIANRAPNYRNTTTGDASTTGARRFCFKLDQLGFFASQHYIPLEWMPVTIEITFHQVNRCLRTDNFAGAGGPPFPIADNIWSSATYLITEPQFHSELLTFNAEYTAAVNNKIVSDGAIIPIKSYRHTSQFFTGRSQKMILTMKVKSLTRLLVVPRLNSVVTNGGLGMDQFISKWTQNANQPAGVATVSASTPAAEFTHYRFLIGSNPVTDHSIDCRNGGANQAMEVVKYFRSLGNDLSFGYVNDVVSSGAFADNFKTEYGLIAQNFNLEKIESDDVFTGQFANTFSDLTLELDASDTIADADKILLDFYLQVCILFFFISFVIHKLLNVIFYYLVQRLIDCNSYRHFHRIIKWIVNVLCVNKF